MEIDAGARKPDRVTSLLTAQIREGRWQPGERLPSERDLSRSLGVSRGAVREALATLKRAGHIDTRLGEGSFVTSGPSERTAVADERFLATLSIADALEIREDLDVAAVALAVHRRRNSDVLRIRRAAERLDALISRGDFAGYLDATLELHLEIAKASHSDILLRWIGELVEAHRKDHWVLQERYTPEVGAYSLQVHQQLAQGVVDRDYAAAVEATCRHYEDYPVPVNLLLP